MLSFLKKLFGSSAPANPPAAAVGKTVTPAPTVDSSRAGQPVDCAGLDWNEPAQLAFANEVLGKHAGEQLSSLLLADKFKNNRYCSPADAAVIFAIVSEYQPTRLMEVGSGYSTMVLRHAMKVNNLPAELISIDPEPRVGVGEYVDAELFMRVQEVPVDDFKMLQAGELVLFDTTHRNLPGGETEHIINNILPELASGVIVGFHGVRLPMNYSTEELREGFAEQEVLLRWLCSSGKADIFYSGGWLKQNHRAALEAALGGMPGAIPPQSTSLWFRIA